MRHTGQVGRAIGVSAALLLLAGAAGAQGAKPLSKCAPDAVASGSVCIDKYEASVWRVVNRAGENEALVAKIRQGTATLQDLSAAAEQLGSGDDYAPCTDNGRVCGDVYAVSIPSVAPSAHITWFQAQQACKNSRKRLPTNAEWQLAASGTPDPGGDDAARDCNTGSTQTVVPTGSREQCVSADGAFDMVGNLSEWVGDSVPLLAPPSPAPCGSWASGDQQCLSGDTATTGGPGVLQRGGNATSGPAAGPLAIADAEPSPPSTTTTTTTTTTAPPTTEPTTTTTSSTTTTTLPPLLSVGFRCVR